MTYGSMQCLGSPLHIKNKYGEGFRLNIISENPNASEVTQSVLKYLPNAYLANENAGNFTFKLDGKYLKELSSFCELLENKTKPFDSVRDWGISQSTLEDVFIKFSKEKFEKVYKNNNLF